MIGLSCALQLRRRGHHVTVFDAGEIGAGASAGNAGWIVPSLSAPVAAPGALSYGMRSLFHRSGGFSIRATPHAVDDGVGVALRAAPPGAPTSRRVWPPPLDSPSARPDRLPTSKSQA
ncbi:FAD-dependent oxidoreductase [Microbacterium oxydans]|nr:FAD-dependent oxidoreductase [Microbacterium oxydans]